MFIRTIENILISYIDKGYFIKLDEKNKAIKLRRNGYAINKIASEIGVAKSSVSLWVRDVKLTDEQTTNLKSLPFTTSAIENRRSSRLKNELEKRQHVISLAKSEITNIDNRSLWLIGVMLYWAEGGKTQRMVRFSNGDPKMIKIIMRFFELICEVPAKKFRGHIHIHQSLDSNSAENYWSNISGIPLNQFFKTYRKPNKSSQNKKNTLPNGVLDVYVLDTKLFYKIQGWAEGIFEQSEK